MTQSLQCPRCGGTQIGQERRRRNPKTGNSVGVWFLGCLVQLVLLSGIAGGVAFAIRAAWPGQLFAEAALLTGTIAMIYLVGAGALCLWLRCWPLIIERTCQVCSYTWVADARSESPGIPSLHEGKPNV